jgi:hypothetical protein
MRLAVYLFITLAAPVIGHAKTIHVPLDYGMIQEAINAAVDGDTVLVAPGVYYELIDFKGKGITVMGSDGPDTTFICGGFFGSVVTFQSGEGLDSVLNGFSIVYGSGTFDPTWGYLGGGIYCIGSSPMISENIISNNLAMGSLDTMGGGGGICTSFNSSPTIIKNTIIDNTHTGPSWEGSGVGITVAYNSAPLIEGNIISGNSSLNGNGGAITVIDSCSSTISNNLICNNSVGRSTGAIAVHLDCSVVISNNIIYHNSAAWFASAISYTGDTTITITGNIIYENTAQGTSGAITCGNPGSIASITNNIINGNTGHGGGGVRIIDGAKATLTNNTIYGNSASNIGGGIRCEGASAMITNTILWNNQAPIGPGICLLMGSTVDISCSDVEGGQLSCYVDGTSTLNWDSGNIDSNPLFVDSSNDDYHLTFNSPCRASGDNSAVTELTDFEGDPRVAYGTVDMGADEFYSTCTGQGMRRRGETWKSSSWDCLEPRLSASASVPGSWIHHSRQCGATGIWPSRSSGRWTLDRSLPLKAC